MRRLAAALLGWTLLGAAAEARQMDVFEHAAVMESLRGIPPKQQAQWLRQRGITIPGITEYRQQESTGLRLVGQYGRGRSWDVAGQDSLLFIALGSEIAVLSITDPAQPAIITELQLDYLPAQVVVRDSVLVTGRNGIDIWNITDPAHPVRRSHIPKVVSGHAVVDTFLYFVSGDTFNVYSIARPSEPVRLGSCRDSGYVVTATSRTAVLLTRDFLALVDVTNPSAPHRVSTYPGWPLAAQVRGNLLCATFTNPSQPEQSRFATVDISNPASPLTLASLNSVCGVGLYLEGPYAFTSGRTAYEPMRIVSIADSTSIAVVGELRLPPSGEGWGVWADLSRNRAYVAWDGCGVQAVDVSSITTPVLDTTLLVADMAVDVSVDGNRAYVADSRAGLRILDITDPARPAELGARDTMGIGVESVTAVARDSFAFLSWRYGHDQFRSVLVSDPSRPLDVASLTVPSRPEDMVLRDTLVYAVGNQRFYIVNVARPREPRLVGSCVIQEGVWGLTVRDTLAFVAGVSMQVVSVADPSAPRLVGTIDRGCIGVAVWDTFAYVPSWDTLFVYSVADPAQARVLSATPTGRAWDVAIGDSVLFIGTNDGVEAYSISNPTEPRRTGQATAPYSNRRLCYAGGYLYSAIWDAGVAVYETTTTGLTEHETALPAVSHCILAAPNPAGRFVRLTGVRGVVSVAVHDAAGREQPSRAVSPTAGSIALDVAGLSSGVYFAEVKQYSRTEVVRFVKR